MAKQRKNVDRTFIVWKEKGKQFDKQEIIEIVKSKILTIWHRTFHQETLEKTIARISAKQAYSTLTRVMKRVEADEVEMSCHNYFNDKPTTDANLQEVLADLMTMYIFGKWRPRSVNSTNSTNSTNSAHETPTAATLFLDDMKDNIETIVTQKIKEQMPKPKSKPEKKEKKNRMDELFERALDDALAKAARGEGSLRETLTKESTDDAKRAAMLALNAKHSIKDEDIPNDE